MKQWLEDDVYITVVVVILVGIAGFGLGRLSMVGDPVKNMQSAGVSRAVQQSQTSAGTNTELTEVPIETMQNYVASRNGTKYHALSCPGAKQISETNKIYFTTVDEARASGYTPAANCPGL